MSIIEEWEDAFAKANATGDPAVIAKTADNMLATIQHLEESLERSRRWAMIVHFDETHGEKTNRLQIDVAGVRWSIRREGDGIIVRTADRDPVTVLVEGDHVTIEKGEG